MVKRITADETHLWLKDYFRRRPDIGLGKALADLALNPQNPFEPEKRRLPKRGLLLAAGVFLSVVGWFLYFNLAR